MIVTYNTEHTSAPSAPQGAQAACAAEGGQTPTTAGGKGGPMSASHRFELEHSICPTLLHPAETRTRAEADYRASYSGRNKGMFVNKL